MGKIALDLNKIVRLYIIIYTQINFVQFFRLQMDSISIAVGSRINVTSTDQSPIGTAGEDNFV